MRAAMNDARLAKFGRRKTVNKIALVLSLAAMSFGLFWLFWILWETFDWELAASALPLSLK